MKFDEIFESNYECGLHCITFSTLPSPTCASDVQLQLKDTVTVSEKTTQNLYLTIERVLEFTPPSLFDMKISYSVVLSFKQSNSSCYTEKQFEEYFSSQNNPVFSSVFSRISSLIAQITGSSGQAPIITPPILIHPKTT